MFFYKNTTLGLGFYQNNFNLRTIKKIHLIITHLEIIRLSYNLFQLT